MYTWLAATVLLYLVLLERSWGCRPDLIAMCKDYDLMTESRIILPNPEKIDVECDRYNKLFDCITGYLGTCSFKQRLTWQPIVEQIRKLCSSSREAYVEYGSCWDNELESEIYLCYDDLKVQIDEISPCRAIDNFIVCVDEATTDLCNVKAAGVMEDLATSFVSMPRERYKCISSTSASTTSVTSTIVSTSTTAKPTKGATDRVLTSSSVEMKDADQDGGGANRDVRPDSSVVIQTNIQISPLSVSAASIFVSDCLSVRLLAVSLAVLVLQFVA